MPSAQSSMTTSAGGMGDTFFSVRDRQQSAIMLRPTYLTGSAVARRREIQQRARAAARARAQRRHLARMRNGPTSTAAARRILNFFQIAR